MAFVAPSVIVHVAIVWLLPSLRERARWTPGARTVEIDIVHPSVNANANANVRDGGKATAGVGEQRRVSAPSRPAPDSRALSPLPSTEAPGPGTLQHDRRPGPVQLFPGAVLDRLTAAQPHFGGTTRRLGDGRPPPGAPDGERDAAEASARVGSFLREAGGADDARAGRVAPAWRDLERQIDAHFHPRAEQVTTENVGQLLVRQLGNPPVGGSTPRGIDPSRAAQPAELRADQIAACQRAAAEPGAWRTVTIELLVAADGTIESASVILPSGRAELDRHALDAVRRAASVRPTRDPRGPTRSRWSVEAAVAVTPPTVNPIVDPVSGKVIGAGLPALSFTFDESLGKIGFDYPFRKQVRTRVRLLSVEPALPGEPAGR